MILYCSILSLAQHYNNYRNKNKSVIKSDTTYQPFVNIIIPAHNEELVLTETIENILTIDYTY
jgi:cellulose synthase/poly-beta-1,6-N-acetylglucosamine synthase-like glycosyltransferase